MINFIQKVKQKYDPERSSINKIRNYLMGKGINDEFIKETVSKIHENNSDQDFFSALKICKEKNWTSKNRR